VIHNDTLSDVNFSFIDL